MTRFFVLALVVSPLLIAHRCPPPRFATATFSPTSLTFAPQVVSPGESPSASQTVTLTAGGSLNVNITGIDASGGFSETNNCPGSLSAGQSCDIQVSFAPNSIGTITGAITLTSNAMGSPHVVSLSGTGIPAVGFSPSSLDFGNVAVNTTSGAQTITLTNNQGGPLAISSIDVSGNYSQTHNCPPSLAGGASCQISVQFTPTLAGTIPGALNVTSNASPGTEPVGLTGLGTGSSSSSVSFSKTNLAFGNQEAGSTSTQESITLTNQGSTSLTVQSVSASAGYASTDTCSGKVLSHTETCGINVKFQPDADFAPVDYPGAITVMDSDASSPQVVGLSGTGVAPITFSPAALDFGQVLVNSTSAPQTLTLSNNDAATQGFTLAESGGFTVADTTCGSSLGSGATCTADVTFSSRRFQSIGYGPINGAMTITPSGSGFLSPQVVNLKACATSIQISPPSFNFGAVAVGSTGTTETVTVSGTIFNVSSTAITGADPGDFTITNNTCASSVSGSCTMDVTYAPQASGVRSGTVTVTDDDACSPHQQPLSGGSSKGPFIVTAATGGTGTGTFSSSPAGIDCGSNGTACSASFTTGTMVTLTAIPDDGSHFTGWSQACTGAGTCVLDMISDQQLTAGFDLNPDLAVSFPGNGSGTVNSNPAGINCTSSCDARFTPGTMVLLTASPAAGTSFAGWGGACSGTGSCAVTMNSDQSVSANFIAPTFSLSASAPSTLSPGQSTTSNVTLTSVNGFNSTVNFTCSVQPAPALAPTCGMNPSSATPAANASVSSTLTMNTLAPSFSAIPLVRRFFYALWLPIGGLAWMGIGFSWRPNRKRRLWLAILSCALAAGVVLHAACGSSSPKQTASGGTPTGNYTVTITGTSGATQISTTVTLTVQ